MRVGLVGLAAEGELTCSVSILNDSDDLETLSMQKQPRKSLQFSFTSIRCQPNQGRLKGASPSFELVKISEVAWAPGLVRAGTDE